MPIPFFVAVLFVATIAPDPSVAPIKVEARKVDGWEVSGRDGVCSMLRPDVAGRPSWVVLSQRIDGQQFIRVHSARWNVVKGKPYQATLDFDGTAIPLDARGSITDGATKWGGFTAITGTDWQSRLADAKRMTATLPGNPTMDIDLAGASTAHAAMRQCVEDLRRSRAPVLMTPPEIVTPLTTVVADYPAEARAERRQGTSVVLLTVGTSGRVTDCTVSRTSGSLDLDQHACALSISRMRFKPAVAADGNPVQATYQYAVGWRL